MDPAAHTGDGCQDIIIVRTLYNISISLPLLNLIFAGQESFLSCISAISHSVSVSNIQSLHSTLRHSSEGEGVGLHTRRGERSVFSQVEILLFSLSRTNPQRSPAGTVMGNLSTILTYLSNPTNNLCQFLQGNLFEWTNFHIEQYFFRGVYNPLYKQSESLIESPENFISVS